MESIWKFVFCLAYIVMCNFKFTSGACSQVCPCINNRAFCNGMYLKVLPTDFPEDLVHMDLSDNKLGSVTYSMVGNFKKLNALVLAGNGLSYIEPGTFRDMRQLAGLDISRNNLGGNVSQDMLLGLRNLEAMTIAHNELVEVDELFVHLRKINILNLKNNQIRFISGKTFKNNIRLRYLDLSRNHLVSINKEAFKPLRRLRYLILNNNKLADLHRLSFDAHKLLMIDFTNCQLSVMIRGLPRSTQDLRMAHNRIRYIGDKVLYNNTRLRTLTLSHNKIHSIHDETFRRLRSLQELHLDHNHLTKLPRRLPLRLVRLFLEHNQLEYITDNNFRHSRHLEMVNLQYNQIEKLGKRTLKGLTALRNLDLEHNNIKISEDKAFLSLERLQTLDLSNNPITDLKPECFKGLKSIIMMKMRHIQNTTNVPAGLLEDMRVLRYLDLTDSPPIAKRIIDMDLIMGFLQSVSDLNLMHDQLHRLRPDFPQYLPKLRSLKLAGNPWCCDRLLTWLRRWMFNGTVDFVHRHDIRCAIPQSVQQVQLKDLQPEELDAVEPVIFGNTDNPYAQPEPEPNNALPANFYAYRGRTKEVKKYNSAEDNRIEKQ